MNFGLRQPAINQTNHAFPSESAFLLASTLKRVTPISPNLKPKHIQRVLIRRHSKIPVVPSNNRPQPLPNFGNRIVHPFAQFDFDFLQLRSQSLLVGSADNHKHPIACLLPHNVGESKKVETLRPSQSTFDSVVDRKWTKFDQTRLFRMKCQRELLESRLQLSQKLLGNSKILKSNNEIVGPAYDNDVSAFALRSPLLNPQIEGVVQKDIRQQRRNHPALDCPFLSAVPFSVLQDPRVEPLSYQSHNAFIHYPVLDKLNQPVMVDGVKEPLDIGIQNIIHFPRLKSNIQRIQTVMLASPRSISIRESEKVRLVDCIQYQGRCVLDDFILQCEHPQRSLLAVSFGYVRSLDWLCSIGSTFDSLREIFQVFCKLLRILSPRDPIYPCRHVPLETIESLFEYVDRINVMHQSRELLLFIFNSRSTYPLKRTLHPLPALYPVDVLLLQISFGQLPFLHRLRGSQNLCGLETLVRQLRRYYATVRLPMFVHHCITSLDFPIRSSSTIALEEHGISRFSRELLVHMHGVSDPARSQEYLPCRTLECCLPHFLRASAPQPLLTRLNTQPMHTIINASQTNLRTSVHDLCPVWVANPSLSGTFIRKLTRRFIPAHKEKNNDYT